MPMSQKDVSAQEQSVSDWLRELTPPTRFALGLFVCALAAYHIPLIVCALAGKNVNTISQWGVTLISVTILIVQNLIGNKIRRIMTTGVVLAAVVFCWSGLMIFHSFRLSQAADWWPLLWEPVTWFPLNAYLFKRYKAATGL